MSADVTTIELRNDLSEIGRLAVALEEFADRHALPPRVLTQMNLAIEEIVTNIISYGYEDSSEHRIRIDLAFTNRQVTTRIEDDGKPFDPMQAKDPDVTAPLEERGVGGLGILLVKTLMDDVVYSRDGNRNVLLMTKNADTPDA